MSNNRRGFGEQLRQRFHDALQSAGDKLSHVMKGSAKPRAGGRMSADRLDSSQTPIRSGAASQSTVPNRPAQQHQQKFKVPFGFTHKKRFVAVLSGVVAAIMIPVLVSSAGGAGFYTSTGGTVDYAVPSHVDTVSGSSGAHAVTAYTQAVVRTEASASSETEPAAGSGSGSSQDVTTSGRNASVSLSGYDDQDRSEPEPTEDPYMNLEPGISNDDVITLQQRLMDLHYLENDEPTNYYGPQTQQAVGYFQRKHGLDVDGYAGPKTQDLLFSDNAKPYTVTVGAQGADVWNIQERLEELGYPISVTGYYGSQTADAVAYFQRMSGITDDGTVGIDTKDLLYSDTAEPAIPPEPEPEPEEEAGGSESSGGGSSSGSSESSSGSSSTESSSSEGSSSGSSSSEESSSGSSSSGSSSSSSSHDDEEEEEQSSSSGSSGGSNVPSASSGSVEAFVDAACAQEGKPYVLGGKGPNTFDCSGLVYYALNASGYKIGYMTSGGWAGSGYPSISWDNLQRGDVLCFSGHVGVYLGGGMMCDASSSNGRIMIRSMGSWARNNFICGKRPLAA
ncbi:MAG: hypothetical protein HDQ87_03560 [Clostridia bacterium]|nr:hypothetical protein [Clostridia bacterium]